MIVLGIGGSTHDFSACVVIDGVVMIAIEEERLSRIKHHSLDRLEISDLKLRSVDYCLDALGITLEDVNLIVANDLVHRGALRGLTKVRKVNHHLSHAALVSYLSPEPELAILVVDGFGSVTRGTAEIVSYFKSGPDRHPELVHREFGVMRRLDNAKPRGWKNFDFVENSVGELYSWITRRIGFGLHEEGKTMGLAPYGSTRHAEALQDAVSLDEVGGVTFNTNTRARLSELMRATTDDQQDSQERADQARAAQELLEQSLMRRAKDLHNRTGSEAMGLGGGVFLNSAANRRLIAEGPFGKIHMHGATGDSGTAIGSALLAYAESTGLMPSSDPGHVVYTGREYSGDDIRDALLSTDGIEWCHENTVARAAEALADGKVIGWFQGRSEFGPRALGNRSILADPGRPGMKDRINNVIKHREPFRPFAPSIMFERQSELIDTAMPSWYMCINGQVLLANRERLAAATHVDYSARYQTVSRDSNPRYHELIERFSALTGTAALLNTSFNDSEPIVESPRDALAAFLRTDLDCLVLGDYFVAKGEVQPIGRCPLHPSSRMEFDNELETSVDENDLIEPKPSAINNVVEILRKRLEWPTDIAAPDPSTPLGDNGIGLDSLMIVEFALDLEEEFDIEIGEDEMLDIGTMSIAQVAKLVENRTTDSST